MSEAISSTQKTQGCMNLLSHHTQRRRKSTAAGHQPPLPYTFEVGRAQNCHDDLTSKNRSFRNGNSTWNKTIVPVGCTSHWHRRLCQMSHHRWFLKHKPGLIMFKLKVIVIHEMGSHNLSQHRPGCPWRHESGCGSPETVAVGFQNLGGASSFVSVW